MDKNHKATNSAIIDKMRFDSAVNDDIVIIKQILGSSKNEWHILKSFNKWVEQIIIVTIIYCVLHNYREIQHECVPMSKIVDFGMIICKFYIGGMWLSGEELFR